MKTKTPLLIFFILSILGLEVNAQKPEDLLSKANELYNNSAYDSAVVMYKKVIDKGYSSSTLYYNLGNTYYKLRDYPMAIFYYEKSLKLDPNNEDTKHNLEIANAFISDKIETVPDLFIKAWWNNLSNIFTANTWAVISLIVLAILLSCIFLYLIARTRILKKSMFFSCIFLILITISIFSITTKKYNYIKSNNNGIIIAPTITVKSSPSTSSVDLFVLHEGSKIKILDNTGDWEKIKIANGSIGWLPSSSIIKF